MTKDLLYVRPAVGTKAASGLKRLVPACLNLNSLMKSDVLRAVKLYRLLQGTCFSIASMVRILISTLPSKQAHWNHWKDKMSMKKAGMLSVNV